MKPLIERDPNIEVQLDIAGVVHQHVVGNTGGILLNHVRPGGPSKIVRP